jgi:hypothetical protein
VASVSVPGSARPASIAHRWFRRLLLCRRRGRAASVSASASSRSAATRRLKAWVEASLLAWILRSRWPGWRRLARSAPSAWAARALGYRHQDCWLPARRRSVGCRLRNASLHGDCCRGTAGAVEAGRESCPGLAPADSCKARSDASPVFGASFPSPGPQPARPPNWPTGQRGSYPAKPALPESSPSVVSSSACNSDRGVTRLPGRWQLAFPDPG